jgi:membrane protein required for colicin V production
MVRPFLSVDFPRGRVQRIHFASTPAPQKEKSCQPTFVSDSDFAKVPKFRFSIFSSNQGSIVQAYDLIMLIVLGMSTIFGAIKGLAWQVASLASIIVSYVVACQYRGKVAGMIDAQPPWNMFLAMLILYVGTGFVIWVGFRLMSSAIDKIRLKEFDRHLGALFGLGKGLIFCLLITMFAMTLLGPKQQSAICQSRSGYYISAILDKARMVLPQEVHSTIGGYLARLDNQLKQGQQGQFDPNQLNADNLINMPNLSNLSNGLEQLIPSNLNQLLPQQQGGNSNFQTQQPQPASNQFQNFQNGGFQNGFQNGNGFGAGQGAAPGTTPGTGNGFRSTGGNNAAELPSGSFSR